MKKKILIPLVAVTFMASSLALVNYSSAATTDNKITKYVTQSINVSLKQAQSRPKNGIGVKGSVLSIDGDTILVSAKTNGFAYSVDASNASIYKGSVKSISTISNIQVGDMVSVRGVVSGNNIKAKTIFDGLLVK